MGELQTPQRTEGGSREIHLQKGGRQRERGGRDALRPHLQGTQRPPQLQSDTAGLLRCGEGLVQMLQESQPHCSRNVSQTAPPAGFPQDFPPVALKPFDNEKTRQKNDTKLLELA